MKKRIVTLALAAVMAIGGSLSVFAATGFTVSNPSLSYLNDGYFVTGSMSYTNSSSSGSYYVRVDVKGNAKINGYSVVYEKAGYGYASTSATTEKIPTRPFYMENKGSYKSGTTFTVVDTKYVNYP